VGSFFYLSFGLYQSDSFEKEALWSITGFMVLLSIVVHGVTAYPVMHYLDRHRTRSDLNAET
jgi:sodium/hydrogen antiporter